MTKGKMLVDALSFDFLPTSKKNIDRKASDKRVAMNLREADRSSI